MIDTIVVRRGVCDIRGSLRSDVNECRGWISRTTAINRSDDWHKIDSESGNVNEGTAQRASQRTENERIRVATEFSPRQRAAFPGSSPGEAGSSTAHRRRIQSRPAVRRASNHRASTPGNSSPGCPALRRPTALGLANGLCPPPIGGDSSSWTIDAVNSSAIFHFKHY